MVRKSTKPARDLVCRETNSGRTCQPVRESWPVEPILYCTNEGRISHTPLFLLLLPPLDQLTRGISFWSLQMIGLRRFCAIRTICFWRQLLYINWALGGVTRIVGSQYRVFPHKVHLETISPLSKGVYPPGFYISFLLLFASTAYCGYFVFDVTSGSTYRWIGNPCVINCRLYCSKLSLR